MAAGLEGAAGISGEDDRQVIVVVAVAIGDAAAVYDHRVVEQALAVHVLGGFQPLEEVGELLHVEEVDLGDLLEVFLLPLVVGDVVVAVGDADLLEAAVAAVVGEHQRGDAGGVGLESQHHHVHQQAEVLLVAARIAFRRGLAGVGWQAHGFGLLDLLLDLADAGQVFVELLLVAAAEVAVEGLGVVLDEVEHRLLGGVAAAEAFGSFLGIAGAEEPFEDRARVRLRGHGLVFRAPGKVELVGAGVAGITGTGLADAVGGEFQRGQAGLVADGVGGDLVDRDAEVDVRAGGLAGAAAGQESGDTAGVVAGAVATGGGELLLEAGEDLEVGAVGLHRLEGRAHLVAAGGAVWPPVLQVHAVRDVEVSHAEGRAAGGGGQGAAAGFRSHQRAEDVQRRQTDGGTQTAEESTAAGEGGVLAHRVEDVRVDFRYKGKGGFQSSPRRFWNGALSTMP